MIEDMFEDTLTVRYYARPHGRIREIEMSNIDQSEIRFFIEMDIQVSIEELSTGDIIVYGCPRHDESEESEVMVFAGKKNCQDTMKALREECERAFL
jgi:coenzyme F420-reducing hydrogenase gamma subunit